VVLNRGGAGGEIGWAELRLFEAARHAAALSSRKRVEEASAAWAKSPCRQPVTVTSSRLVARSASDDRSQATDGPSSRSRKRARVRAATSASYLEVWRGDDALTQGDR
jgi:hypothetical protein